MVAVLFSAACISREAIVLPSAEVREYEGEDLSSIADFRENSIKGPQNVSLEGYRLEVDGLVEKPLSLTYEDVLSRQSYKKVVTLYCVEGWDVTILWEGVLVSDLIDEAMPIEAETVIFHAVDGYTTSLPLDYLERNDILLAYKMNNATLPVARGFPFQLAAEEKWGYKWIKWVDRITLSNQTDYRGYWESRGYNENGSVSGPIFER